MEHVISMGEFHSRQVEIEEAGESSRDNDQPVIVAGTSSKDEKFKKLKEAQAKVQLGTTPKIREVLMLRDHKHYRKYCEPRVVSLGPIHHGKPKYQLMEEYKLMLADKFIGRTGRTDKELYGIIKDKIKELREYYDEKVTQKYCDEDLAWMLFVDGCAILQFIDSIVNDALEDVKMKNDQVAFVRQDLFLLENQLPYQLLDYLVENTQNSEDRKRLKTSIRHFMRVQSMVDGCTIPPHDEKAIHLLDLLRKTVLGLDGVKDQMKVKSVQGWDSPRNVQELKAAGINLKYRNSNYNNLGNIAFVRKWFYGGVLWMPKITVDESTGPMFFNLAAYEMSPDFENDYGVTSYISFLDSLIHEAKDVMHLKQAGIVRNLLGNDENVAQVFNEIGTDLVPNPEIYRDVGDGLQNYYHNKKVMIWISETLYTRLNNPLSFPVLAFGGAVLALTFSLVQMIYAILSYEYQRRH
ncbi:hypothetical protein CMV_027598 [Castanea mollissima]|uniref:Uncharacterized protein n=1 Tax=Castanea mollissima TaxID=60419 RepID=A0A8J4Q9B7_9ROSI|nr:hypothetical protein CMV_027598 [Castanea mollissima]